MLGLRLDEPLPMATIAESLDGHALARLERLGLARRIPLADSGASAADDALTLTARGRLLGDAVTADLLT